MPDDNVTEQPAQVTTPPETSQGNTEGSQQQPTAFTQADVDRIVADRAKRAEKSAISGLLETLGLDSIDSLKTTIDSERKRKEAEMSATEKLQAELDAMKQTIAEKDAALSEANQTRLNEKRDSSLLQLLSKAHDPHKALLLIKAEKADVVNNLLAEDGTFDGAVAEKLVADYAAANAYLFSSGAPGSPSNNDGRTPQPDLKAAQNEVAKKFGRL